MSNVLPVGSGPFRRGLLSRYDTTQSIQQRTRKRERRKNASKNRNFPNRNDAMFFAATPATGPAPALQIENVENEQVLKLQHAITLPYLQTKAGMSQTNSRRQNSSQSSLSLPQLRSNEDKRIEDEVREQRRLRRERMRKKRTAKQKTAAQRQQRELYSQNVRYLKQQQNRGLRDRQKMEYRHNGFLRKENAEKELAKKVEKENMGVSKELVQVAAQAQQKADEYVKKIMIERQAKLELDQLEREKKRKEEEEATLLEYQQGANKQERLQHWSQVQSPDSMNTNSVMKVTADDEDQQEVQTEDEQAPLPMPMHHYIAKSKNRTSVKPRNTKASQSPKKPMPKQEKLALEEAKKQEKTAEQEKRKAKAKLGRLQQRAEREKEREMWRRLDEMAVTDGMLNGASTQSAADVTKTIAVDWNDLEQQSKLAVEQQKEERRLRKEEARLQKIEAERQKQEQWQEFLAMEQTGGIGMQALLQTGATAETTE